MIYQSFLRFRTSDEEPLSGTLNEENSRKIASFLLSYLFEHLRLKVKKHLAAAKCLQVGWDEWGDALSEQAGVLVSSQSRGAACLRSGSDRSEPPTPTL